MQCFSANTSDAFVWSFSTVDSLDEKGKNASVLLVCSLYIAHQLPLLALGEELVRRGHRVAVIGPVIEGVSTLPDIPLSKGMEFYHGGNISEKYHRTAMNGLKNVTSSLMFLYNASKTLKELSYDNFLIPLRKGVDKLNSSEWDFIVVDNVAVTILHYIMKEWDTETKGDDELFSSANVASLCSSVVISTRSEWTA